MFMENFFQLDAASWYIVARRSDLSHEVLLNAERTNEKEM